ncbi:MAG: hypothetical protein FWC56_01405, partial [Phycisphaerae bacterium]|nr:hypothetical protein [Phycisphaerae bacterium]
MSQPLRICLFNPDIQLPLHQPFHDLPNIRILGQVASSEELLEGLGKLNIDLLVVNLDAECSLELIEQFRQTGAHCGILGVS